MDTNRNNLEDIKQTVMLNAPIEKVWKAVATAEGIAAWFMPNDFQPIEGYDFHLNAGPFGMSPCKVTVLNPPHELSFKWGKDWTITFSLVDKGDATEFTLKHGGWTADQVTEFGQPHAIVRENMATGWVGIVQKLSGYVEV